MTYIKDLNHFYNYIMKSVKESQILDIEKIQPIEFYMKNAYEYRDQFAWKLREDITILYEDNFWPWLNIQNTNTSICTDIYPGILTNEFIDVLESLKKIPGIYSFWNFEGSCLYIGVSNDLSARIISSFKERFTSYSEIIILQYIQTKTCSDAHVYEAYMISKYKPALNSAGKYQDELTIELEIPEFSAILQCNIPGEKVWVKTNNYSGYWTQKSLFDRKGM